MLAAMSEQERIVGTAKNFLELRAAFRQRLTGELGLTYDTMDALAGWGSTYATKLLSPEPSRSKDANGWRPTARALGPMSFDALLGLACVKLVLVEDPAALARLQRHRDFMPRKRPVQTDGSQAYVVHRVTREHMRQIGRLGGASRWAKVSAKRRSSIARAAARARWARPKSVAVPPA
jgi:hypothetical protein